MSQVGRPPEGTSNRSSDWTIQDARELYLVDDWGQGHFVVNERGHLAVRARPDLESPGETHAADLVEIARGLTERGLAAPFLLRFPHILDQRMSELHAAFHEAIVENDYRGDYVAVFPTKVSEHRQVVEQVFETGAKHQVGLEVGTMPELLAVIALTAGHNDRMIVCNGFKDDGFIEAVMLAARLGRHIVPVVDNFPELDRILKFSQQTGVRPNIGVRIKLSREGVGRWSQSAGSGAKFGLTVIETLEMVEQLERHGMLDCLQMLHCHIGSQVEDIRAIKDAVDELAMLYVELSRLGANLKFVDVGGGMGVDYDGTQRSEEPSINYTTREYASSVVYRFTKACDSAQIEHPTIVSESGRAMVAHNSVLVFEMIGATSPSRAAENLPTLQQVESDNDKVPRPVVDLYDALDAIAPDTLAEVYHDATHAYRSALDLFSHGYLPIEMRALAEKLYWACLRRMLQVVRDLEEPPAELDELELMLSEIYFGNFSVFQSLPDSWAIDQVFPIVPLQRLDERPTVKAMIADVTCDSDGKIERFISPDGISSRIDLHDLREDETYYVGVFLVGAYQEALGDIFNLFGDTNVASVTVDAKGGWHLENAVFGDTSREVLGYIEYDVDQLFNRVMRDCQTAIREHRVSAAESRDLLEFYRVHLDSYTYLE